MGVFVKNVIWKIRFLNPICHAYISFVRQIFLPPSTPKSLTWFMNSPSRFICLGVAVKSSKAATLFLASTSIFFFSLSRFVSSLHSHCITTNNCINEHNFSSPQIFLFPLPFFHVPEGREERRKALANYQSH